MEIIKKLHLFTVDEKLKKFGYGEWIEELDYIGFVYNDYFCDIHRNTLGVLVGYVFLDSNHPWHGKPYDEIEANVHGNLTYGEKYSDSMYIIGFDCAHFGDYVPGLFFFSKRKQKLMKVTNGQMIEDLGKLTKT